METSFSFFPVAVYWAKIQGLSIHPNLLAIIVIGLLIGAVTGFFGVGGRLMTSPLLYGLINMPYNVAVGSDISQMMGTATMNIIRFKRMSRIDLKLGSWMLAGTIVGIEMGARILELLKQSGTFTLFGSSWRIMPLVMSVVYSALLLWIGLINFREARGAGAERTPQVIKAASQPVMTARLQHVKLPPMISLPVSGIEAISLWVIIGMGMATGLLVGFLGAGGGFIRLPALIYVIGCPMVVAIGTDLFESIFSLGYGTLTHSLKGNIDLILVVILLITGAIGNQVGAVLSKRYTHPGFRQVFAAITFAVVLLLVIKLTGIW